VPKLPSGGRYVACSCAAMRRRWVAIVSLVTWACGGRTASLKPYSGEAGAAVPVAVDGGSPEMGVKDATALMPCGAVVDGRPDGCPTKEYCAVWVSASTAAVDAALGTFPPASDIVASACVSGPLAAACGDANIITIGYSLYDNETAWVECAYGTAGGEDASAGGGG
jgi:hypothetical protein